MVIKDKRKISPIELVIWENLKLVVDPEIPIVSIVELGILRDVSIEGNSVDITIAPTFSSCPALHEIEEAITHIVQDLGYSDITIAKQYDPPWTTDWISEIAREKIKKIGLAPPHIHQGDFISVLIDPVTCPYCNSDNTSLKNSFGPTPCRMIYYCLSCNQPFEQFKPI